VPRANKTGINRAEVEALRRNEAKWSKPLIDAGWNAIPSIIIEKQEALGLDAIDMNIIVHLSNYWWHADNLPCPSVARIAKAIGVQPRTVQKRIKALHDLGLLTRTERRQTRHGSDTNLYSFAGLIKAALPYAEEKIAEREKRKQAEAERLTRKRPKLTVVSNND
jgi:DNA-binding transcriptional regulator YhcF (GntR family)